MMSLRHRKHRIAKGSFDHLIGARENGLRNGEAERPGGLEVDHQFEARRLFDWEIARFGARPNFGNVSCGAPK